MHVVRYVTPTLISSHFNIGENPDTLYDQTRMDGQWNFRHAYDEARKIRDAQDTFCRKVEARAWDALESDSGSIAEFPEGPAVGIVSRCPAWKSQGEFAVFN